MATNKLKCVFSKAGSVGLEKPFYTSRDDLTAVSTETIPFTKEISDSELSSGFVLKTKAYYCDYVTPYMIDSDFVVDHIDEIKESDGSNTTGSGMEMATVVKVVRTFKSWQEIMDATYSTNDLEGPTVDGSVNNYTLNFNVYFKKAPYFVTWRAFKNFINWFEGRVVSRIWTSVQNHTSEYRYTVQSDSFMGHPTQNIAWISSRYYKTIGYQENGGPTNKLFTKLIQNIARIETGTTATEVYVPNEFVIVSNKLYRVTATIHKGDAFTVGTNVVDTTIADEFTRLWIRIEDK